jgi:putative Mg2+ transporter-C (MgtC) family protein
MLIGIGDYMFSFISVFLALTILYVLDFIQFWIDNQFQHRTYKVISREGCEIDTFNDQLKLFKLKLYKIKTSRLDVQTSVELEVAGKAVNLELFNKWLMGNQSVLSFDW